MTSQSRYLSGLAGIAALALGTSRELGHGGHPVLLAAALAVGVQAPLGWWVIRSLGTERFVLAWGVGLAARMALVAMTGLVGAQWFGVTPAGILIPLAALLMVLLALEVVVVALAESRVEAQ